jgi:hypothetical protein
MKTIINQESGTFFRLHGIFGIKLNGSIIFTDDSILMFKKIVKPEGAYIDEKQAADILHYSEIADFTRSFQTKKDVRYQITTTSGQKCTLILNGDVNNNVEKLVSQKTVMYKNLIEKEMKVETSSETAVFAGLFAKHVSGLPLAEGVDTKIVANDERLLFISNTQEFSLSSDRLIDIGIKTDQEIQSSYGSSISGAILGGYLFGAVGAVIGGQMRERKNIIKHHFLIITYKKDSDQVYLSFYIEDLISANKIVSFYSNKQKTQQRIEL